MKQTLANLVLKLQHLKLNEAVSAARDAFANADSIEQKLELISAFQLEDRILYSATPIDFAEPIAEPIEVDISQLSEPDLPVHAFDESQFGDFSQDYQFDSGQFIEPEVVGVIDDAALPITTEVLIVDQSVDDYETLIEAARQNSNEDNNLIVVRLDSDRDGIEQITEALSTLQNIDSIHLISHGNDGGLQLGDSWLDNDSFAQYQSQILGWRSSLSEGADILIYGCNLAASGEGRDLVDSIGALCDCDVAASDDKTGHSSLNADWDLEYSVGDIESELPFELEVLQNWAHALDVTVDAVSTGGTDNQNSVTVSHTVSGGNRLLLVSVGMQPGDEKVDYVTYNGQNLTLIGAEQYTDKSRVEIWSLVAPDTGTNDVFVKLTDDTHKGVTVGVMSFNGVDQATPLVNFTSNSGKSTEASATISSDSDDLVFAVVNNHKGSGAAPNASQTEHWDITNKDSNSSGTTQVGAASVTTTFDIDDEEWAVAAVSIQAAPEFNSIWFSTGGDVNSPSGVNGLDSWTSGEVLSFGDTNLALGSGTSNGTLSSLINLDLVVVDGNGDLDAMHLVTSNVMVGSGANTFYLRPGDLIFSTAEDEQFDVGGTVFEKEDVAVFRPDFAGNYSVGTVAILLDDLSPGGGFLPPNVEGITLIEQDTVFGDTTLRAGDFLFTQLADFAANDVFLFETSTVGAGTTSGNREKLLEGSELGLSVTSSFLGGIELIEKETTLGGETFASGTLLLHSSGDHNVGDNNLSTTTHDIFALNVTETDLVSGNSAATASMFLRGSDIGLGGNDERIDALALGVTPVGLSPTDISPDSLSINENVDTNGGHSLGKLTTTDPNSGDTFTYSILPGSDGSLFSIGGADADELIIDDGIIDYETKTSYTVSVQVTDSTGNVYQESLTVSVTPINDNSPVADTESFTVVEGGTATEADLDSGTSLLDGDTDPDLPLDSLSINTTPIVDVSHGTLVLNSDGTFSYTHDGSENFADSFTYEVIDAAGHVDTATVSISITNTNDAPTVSLANTIPSIPENTTTQTKIADIIVNDDALGTATLSLSGTDSGMFEIIGNELYLRAGQNVDFETNPVLDVTINVDDPSIGSGFEDSTSLSLAVINGNDPAEVSLTNLVNVVNENTTSRVKIADIVVTDDKPGNEILTLSGADASFFEIDGFELYIKAGQDIDFETNPFLDVTVDVNDPNTGNPIDDSASHRVNVADVNEAPSVSLINVTGSLPENIDTTSRIKVADIVIDDDALGFENLTVAGTHGSMFEIVGNELYLRAGEHLDHESLSALDVTVRVDDPLLGSTFEDSDATTIAVDDVNEAPTVALVNEITSLPEDHDTTNQTRVADIVILDDALGSENLILSGSESGLFEIVGSSLYLRAGVDLDFETIPQLDISVEVDDPSIGTASEDQVDYLLDVTDVNEAPHVENPVGTVNAVEDDANVTIDISGVFGDADGDAINLSLGSVSDSSIVSATLVGTDLIIDFLDDQNGSLTIDIIADDGMLSTVETISVNVAPENDAPHLSGDVSLDEIYRDANPAGELTRSIVGAVYNDIDGDAIAGIAVVTNNALPTEGAWQYFGSSGWQDIGTASVTNAVVIDADSLIRFLPANGYFGTPATLEFVAIDGSYSGVFSDTLTAVVDVTSRGGISPFSDERAELGINVRQFGVEVTPTTPLVTGEDGQSASFNVVLLGEPTGEVIIPIVSGDEAEGIPSVKEIRFDASNWSTPQTVTVTGVDDFVDEPDSVYKIGFDRILSTDPQYDGLSVDSLEYTNVDDDSASIVISEAKLQTSENGGTDQFDVRLSSKPTGPVVVRLSVSDSNEAQLSSRTVEFNGSNWNIPQTITITGKNDLLPDGNTEFQVLASARSVADANFASLDPVVIDAVNDAAIGPRERNNNTNSTTNNSPEVSETPTESVPEVESPVDFIPPQFTQGEEKENIGANVIANEPQSFIDTEAEKTNEVETSNRFIATQFARSFSALQNAASLYEESNSVSTEATVLARQYEVQEMTELWGELDSLEERIENQIEIPEVAVGTFAAVASTFSAGYLVWLIRGGQILVGVLSQMPAWSSLDMLTVLSRVEEEEEGKSLESLVSDSDEENPSVPVPAKV